METRHLKAFITTVELSSFTGAARRLGISQSAISQQIMAQERQLGVKLLVRGGKGVKTTPAGEILFHYAHQIVAKVDEAQRMIAEYDEGGTGAIRIGAGGASCEHLLPPVLHEFGVRYPNSAIRVFSGHSDLTMDRLHTGDIDVGMISLPSDTAGLQTFDLGTDELVGIAPVDHPWRDLQRIPHEDFTQRPLIVYERRSSAYKLFERTMVEAGVFPKMAVELDHLGAAVGMVKSGMGISVLPRWAVRELVDRGEILARSIGRNGLFRRWALATPSDGPTSHPIKSFVNLCLDRLPPLLAV